ncbi:serine/threonine-protein kinase RIO2 [Massariosphaeria phaeospora]|uniref:Serine/threonine-protein kinase RIO2 n=1 Tax=Massariosphaeria phaeospora TaxID=100035 RepID=A0A7C8I5L8_9PLEO|nr:serine/threonine-protein kinase RIO2 [Massariosphaeria phaeospora]
MKLDVKNIRYLSRDDWRVLTATEQGSRNHEIVPTPLIASLAALGGGGVPKSISALAKTNLIARVKNARYDGYRLTYGGLDYLALHTHTKAGTVYSVGNQIGVGKESDIFVCAAPETGRQLVLKIHRLGRISFRTVKANRDYLRNRAGGSWMYMSRLAAMKEFEFMKALRREGFPVPEPVGQSRHTVVMSLVDAFPLRQISRVGEPAALYGELMGLIVRLARYGLIHGDFNEFNILVEEKMDADDEDGPITLIPTLIDFPQMVSIDHVNADFYFDRDVTCIKRYFSRRFGFTADEPGPFFKDSTKKLIKRLDVEVEASGFSRKMAKTLEAYMKEHGVDGDAGEAERSDDDDADDAGENETGEGEGQDAQGHHHASEPLSPTPNPPTATTALTPAALASQMTILDIRDTDPLPDLSDMKPLPTSTAPPPSIISTTTTTKSAKAKAGWSI